MLYDLIIIGGGMSGISVGHFFRDHNILILEKGELLAGASGKNAGFVVAGFGEHFRRTVTRFGLDRAREIQDIHRSSHRGIEVLSNKLDGSYSKTGSMTVALDERERAELLQSYQLLCQGGYSVEWLEEPPVGMRQTRGALLNQEDGLLDPVKFWSRLAEGLPLRTNCEVSGLRNESGKITVETSHGSFCCRSVIFCLNAFAGDLVPELKGRYIPLRGQILELPLQAPAPTNRPILTDYGDIYWRFTDQNLIFGGLEHAVPEHEIGVALEVSAPILKEQLRWIQQHFDSDLVGATHALPLRPKVQCSTMAFTLDGFPFVGPLPQENCYVLSGLCGLGNSYAMECARWLHELIVNDRNIIPSYCSSDRISKLPVFTGGNWRTLYEAWNH